MAEEANYNMIDGLMNNVRKKKDKDKTRESVLARLQLNQKKVAKQGKKQTQQKAMTEDKERKKLLQNMWQSRVQAVRSIKRHDKWQMGGRKY